MQNTTQRNGGKVLDILKLDLDALFIFYKTFNQPWSLRSNYGTIIIIIMTAYSEFICIIGLYCAANSPKKNWSFLIFELKCSSCNYSRKWQRFCGPAKLRVCTRFSKNPFLFFLWSNMYYNILFSSACGSWQATNFAEFWLA